MSDFRVSEWKAGMAELREDYDVAVVGGGVAGIAAAAAAARQGAATLLAEKTSALGGTPFAMFHRYLCGLYGNGRHCPPALINGGMIADMCESLRRTHPELEPRRMGRVHVLPFQSAALRQALLGLLPDTPNLDIRLHTEAVSVEFPSAYDASLTMRRTAGAASADRKPVRIGARAVVDCTGDGVLLRQCGAAHPGPSPRALPSAGFAVRFGGIRPHDPDRLAIAVPMALRAAFESGRAPAWLPCTAFHPGDTADQGVCKLSLPPDRSFACALEDARKVAAILREACPEFARAVIAETSPGLAQREGARLRGRYTLSANDVLSARTFPDSAARNAWPIELWPQNSRPRYRYVEEGHCGDIPVECLQSERFPNLWAAGRCLSATSEALASCRVVGVCVPLGETAGRRAALHIRYGDSPARGDKGV